MNSNFLTMIGLGGIDIGYILAGIAAALLVVLVLLVVLLVKYSKLQKRYRKFMRGKDAASLEDDMHKVFEEMKAFKVSTDQNTKDIHVLYKDMEHTFQKLGVVKYDAFQQMGGKLSYSLALLDGKNNGFIINSVHSSEGCYSYTKEVKNAASSISLGAEEEEALHIAMAKQGQTERLEK